MGFFVELAMIYREERMLIDALDCYLRDFLQNGRSSSLNEGTRVFLDHAETVFGLEGRKSAKSLKCASSMLEKLFPHKCLLPPKDRKELCLFHALVDKYCHVNWMLTESENWEPSNPDEKLRKIMILHLSLKDMGWLDNRLHLDYLRRRLTFWKSYNSLIAPLIEESKPSRLPAARRLLGFRPSRPDLYINTQFIVSEESVIYEYSKRERVPIQRSSNGELLFPALWVDKLAKDGLRTPLDRYLRRIYDQLDHLEWTALPVYDAGTHTIDKLPSLASGSQYSYLDKLNVILLALSSISPICHVPLGTLQTRNPSILQLWIRRLFDIMHPRNGILKELNATWESNIQFVTSGLCTCIKQYFSSIDPGSTLASEFSSLVIVYSLASHLEEGSLHRESLEGSKLKSRDNMSLSRLENPATGKSLMNEYLYSFFDWSNVDGLTAVSAAIRIILEGSIDALDVTILMHLIETATCEMIFHMHDSSINSDRFSGLILPLSWAKSLVKRYGTRSITRDTTSLLDFVESIIRLSEELRFNKRRNWLIEDKPLSVRSGVMHILNLRLCWCIAFLLVNSSHPVVFTDSVMGSLIHISGDRDKYGRTICEEASHCFGQVYDQATVLEALSQSSNHEPIVALPNERETERMCNGSKIMDVTYSSPKSILDELRQAEGM